jgi:hypothetical protein
MNKFAKRFFKVLKEQDGPSLERAAMEDSLDKGTDPGAYDVDMDPSSSDNGELAAQAAKIKSAQSQAMTSELTGWVQKCDEFLEFLNGTNGESIQTKLANAEPDTIFDRMKQSEQRKIARVATELASLTESFRGYVAQTENPAFKYV